MMLYTVKKGDNLTRIAKAYGVSVADVVLLNDIENPHLIRIGEKLQIPVKQPPAMEETKATTIAEDFLAYLNAQLGQIYVWGAQGQNVSAMDDPEDWIVERETSDKNAARAIALFRKRKKEGKDPILAFDCSGLIMYYMQNLRGLYSTDLSARGLYAKCAPVERGDLQPGDLLFRHNGKKIHHVGVYVGGGEVIEAMGRDDGVVKRDINASGSGYWNRFGRLRKLQEVGF